MGGVSEQLRGAEMLAVANLLAQFLYHMPIFQEGRKEDKHT